MENSDEYLGHTLILGDLYVRAGNLLSHRQNKLESLLGAALTFELLHSSWLSAQAWRRQSDAWAWMSVCDRWVNLFTCSPCLSRRRLFQEAEGGQTPLASCKGDVSVVKGDLKQSARWRGWWRSTPMLTLLDANIRYPQILHQVRHRGHN